MFAQLLILCSFSLFACIETRQIEFFHDLNFLNASHRHAFIHKDGHTSVLQKGQLRIVNGETAERGQFCYAVYLQFTDGRSTWSCTGSLVSPTVILTAAHCLDKLPHDQIGLVENISREVSLHAKQGTAVLGATDLLLLYEFSRQILRFSSDAIKIHEQYDYRAYNDIGTITLQNGPVLNRYVCTVKLPECSATKQPIKGSDIFTVCGWGKTSDRTRTSKLMYAQLRGQEQSDCIKYYKFNAGYNVIESQMCTSGADGKSTCSGDSGGPLVKNGVQQGIVSLGVNTCEARAPSVYTDLNYFIGWLCPIINKK